MDKNLPTIAGDTGLIPGQGTKIPHAKGQLSLYATTIELSSRAAWERQLLKLVCPRARAPHQEKPPQWGAWTPQLESSFRMHQGRPSATKKKKKKFKYIKKVMGPKDRWCFIRCESAGRHLHPETLNSHLKHNLHPLTHYPSPSDPTNTRTVPWSLQAMICISIKGRLGGLHASATGWRSGYHFLCLPTVFCYLLHPLPQQHKNTLIHKHVCSQLRSSSLPWTHLLPHLFFYYFQP